MPWAEVSYNILIWDYPDLGFSGLPVSYWRPDLSSLFPEFYDRVLERLVHARKTAGVTQAGLAEKLGRPQSFVAKYRAESDGWMSRNISRSLGRSARTHTKCCGLRRRANDEGQSLKTGF